MHNKKSNFTTLWWVILEGRNVLGSISAVSWVCSLSAGSFSWTAAGNWA